MAVNDKFFRDAFRDKGLSLRQVSGMLGMKHHSQLSLLLKGTRRMQLDEAIKLSQILSVPLNTVIGHAGFPEVMQEGKRLNIKGILRGNGEIEEVPELTERVVAPPCTPQSSFGLQARTAGSPLAWMDRWVFFCGEKTSEPSNYFGRLCLVKIKDGPSVLATIQEGYSSNSVQLSGPYQAESVTVEWVAPVLITRN